MSRVAALCGLVILLAPILMPVQTRAADARPPIERFMQVDGRLYRGAQPDLEGFKYLRDLGIGTIINLRLRKDAERLKEREQVESLGMKYVNIPIEDGNFFTRSRIIPEEAILAFFQAIDAAAPGKVFVHCHRGADRTGALVGFYRIVRHQWDGLRAYAEAREIGMRSWYKGLQRQIEDFARQPQVALLRLPQ
jgi:protein tyrosine/serine phosphatase